MFYLSAEYRVSQLSGEEYHSAARSVAVSKKLNSMTVALKIALKHEDPELASVIERNALNLHQSYGNGGGMYALVMAASIKALRSKNPTVRPTGQVQWDEAMGRERELRERPAITSIELLSGLGLAEVRDVNPGYVSRNLGLWK